jgi:diguanylate cyclase (GGDEF)-like protein
VRLSALAGALSSCRRLLRARRFGIVAHLAIGFLAIGALAIAVNLFAVHGTVFVAQAPEPVPVERVVYVEVPVQPVVAAPPVEAASLPVDLDRLTAALAKYERATQQRLENGTDEAEGAFSSAAAGLKAEAKRVAAETGARSGHAETRRLSSRIDALAGQATELHRMADKRRWLAQQYRVHFEAMESRMASALARAWKIFGRVIARESLMELNGRLGEIRRHLAELNEAAAPQGAAPGLEESEAAFVSSLDRNAESLGRSQGTQWVAAMRGDYGLLAASRTEFLRTGNDLLQRTSELARARSEVDASILTLAKTAKASRSAARMRAVSAPAARPPEPPVVQPSVAPATMPISSMPTTARPHAFAGAAVRRSPLLAWVSAAIMLVLLGVSTWTAIRIIRPVRQLERATRELAEGRLDARVRGAGIRELETLGIAFNRMADRLAESQAITEDYQKALEAQVIERTRQLQHLAEHDPLTELPNRRQLFAELTAALRRANPGSDVVGVLVLDLDNFKNINDTMGHSYGDCVLQQVAQRLEAVVAGFGFSARQGGDEFTVVCNATDRVEAVVEGAEAILRAFQEPLIVEGRALAISLSIGVAAFPAHAKDADALLRAADAALFRAKAEGRHRLTVFSPDLLDAAASRFSTEQGLRHAIERGDFELAFQPEVDAKTFEVGLVEALLRWRLPDGRLASPEDFLAVAEDSGLIVEVSDWVLRTAIATASRWHHGTWPAVRIAINVSPRQVAAPGFSRRVAALLREADLPARCIEIELTEHVLQTGESTLATLRELRDLGIGIALDDFGTGYSTLASLEQLPFTRVKLDRSLVARIDSADRSLAIAQTIIDLCVRLGLAITAEGVERLAQLQILGRVPGIFLQGYLLSRPQRADALLQEIEDLPGRMASVLRTEAGEAPVLSASGRWRVRSA